MDSPNTRDHDISSLGTYKSYHNKLDSPGNKLDTTGDVPYSKICAVTDSKGVNVPDVKCAAYKNPRSHTGRKDRNSC